MSNRKDGRETYKSKIKTARSSNYNCYRALSEGIDNSSSTSVKSKNILVKLDLIENNPYKITIEDDGSGIENILETATHGYSRERESTEGNEFGHGYKAAAINLSNNNPNNIVGFISQHRIYENSEFVTMTPGISFKNSNDADQRYRNINNVDCDFYIIGRTLYNSDDIVDTINNLWLSSFEN